METSGSNRRMMQKSVIAAVALAAATSLPAAAQGPATIRGIVYDCGSHRALAGIPVRLIDLDTHARITMRSDANGRFVRVGLTPGRYLIEASGGTPASRGARLETDDVLDVLIGTTPGVRVNAASESAVDSTPHPLCDPALVPMAPSTSDRTIIH